MLRVYFPIHLRYISIYLSSPLHYFLLEDKKKALNMRTDLGSGVLPIESSSSPLICSGEVVI